MWARDANLPAGNDTWTNALAYISTMNSGSGLCGFTDWYLPNRKELHSLTDYSQVSPALPSGHDFINVNVWYWTSTSNAASPGNAMTFNPGIGRTFFHTKGSSYYVWPVRQLIYLHLND